MVKIEWGEFRTPPINLLVVEPAWSFYMPAREKMELFLKEKYCGEDPQLARAEESAHYSGE